MKKICTLLFMVYVLVSCAPSEQQIQDAIKGTNEAIADITLKAPTITPQPTNTVQPTDTSTPIPKATSTATPTPKPTNTPQDTSTPTIAPSETPEKTPIVFSGNSDDIIDIPEDYQVSIGVDLTYTGDSNFIVKVLDNNNEMIDALVNTIGNYNGRRSLGFFREGTPQRLQVLTQGEWSITINPIELAYLHICEIPGECSGQGDDVIVFKTRPDIGAIQHTGNSNFVVRAGADRSEILVNEIGAYTGKVVFPPNTRFVEIIADGEWMMIITD